MTTSLSASLQTWIQNELPHIPPPPSETLESLVESTSTHSLWNFLISRVHSGENLTAIRAAIALNAPRYTPASSAFTTELGDVNREISTLRGEIDALRTKLRQKRHRKSRNNPALRRYVRSALTDISDAHCVQLSLVSNLLPSLSNSQTEEQDQDEELRCAEVLSILSTASGTLDSSELRHLKRQFPISPLLLSTMLSQSLQHARGQLESVPLPRATPIRKARQQALDAQLCAFKELQRAFVTEEEMRERVREMRGEVSGQDLRLLNATMCGEKALGAFLKRRDSEEFNAHTAGLKRSVHRRQKNIRHLEDSARVICKMNSRVLTKCAVQMKELDEWKEGLREKITHVIGILTELSTNINDVAGMQEMHARCITGIAVNKIPTTPIHTLRAICMEKLAREWSFTTDALRHRAAISADRRELLHKQAEQLVATAEHAVLQAENCLQIDAIRVRDELKNLVSQPAKVLARDVL